ncbi:MAG: hypothetical protein JWN34_46 [Bryobacterales bacterium]|nr:hypothetical protein [Bryobacterales bacterium]
MMKALLLLLACAGSATAQTPTSWDALVDRYFDQAVFPFSPSFGTQAGFHQYDAQLESYSPDAVRKLTTLLRSYEREFTAYPGAPVDREILIANIRSTLHSVENIRMWEKNPDLYPSTASNAVFTIMSRKFAAPDVRLRALISRERLIPGLLAEGRMNLKNPPKVYTEVAIEQIGGIINFFSKDVPLAFRDVSNPTLNEDFRRANQGVLRELRVYADWLKRDLLPRSNGDFRIGADNYSKKLLYDEMVDLPLDRLLEIGMADLRHNQEAFRETAKRIDQNRTPQEILAASEQDHPAPDKLLQAFRDTLEGLRQFITAKRIAGIPSPVLPVVEETPPFARALTFASMDMPGPFEKVAKEAFFNVTLPEKDWPAKNVAEHMAAFNRGVITSTAVHEAFPGHYLQGLWLASAPSKARKLLGSNTFIEGWAHYCEQMMMDEGFGNNDPKLRLGQLQDALLRNARYIVGIQMHTGKMTYEQGVDFFVKEGFQTRTNGDRETKRGTADPTYLYYTLGKLEILKLREDYRKKLGAKFTLEEFHNRLLSQGMPALKVSRKALLGDNSPVL